MGKIEIGIKAWMIMYYHRGSFGVAPDGREEDTAWRIPNALNTVAHRTELCGKPRAIFNESAGLDFRIGFLVLRFARAFTSAWPSP